MTAVVTLVLHFGYETHSCLPKDKVIERAKQQRLIEGAVTAFAGVLMVS